LVGTPERRYSWGKRKFVRIVGNQNESSNIIKIYLI
jgi:hypothetical protein